MLSVAQCSLLLRSFKEHPDQFVREIVTYLKRRNPTLYKLLDVFVVEARLRNFPETFIADFTGFLCFIVKAFAAEDTRAGVETLSKLIRENPSLNLSDLLAEFDDKENNVFNLIFYGLPQEAASFSAERLIALFYLFALLMKVIKIKQEIDALNAHMKQGGGA